jgi:hypothetical protein
MIELRSTADYAAGGVKILVYGGSGSGKTTLCSTLDSPVVISAEGGLLALRRHELPYIEIRSLAELEEAYAWAAHSEEATQFGAVCLDSISEIAEVVLAAEKARAKDPRQAYGEMGDRMAATIRAFRDLPRDVYFSAKAEKSTDDLGRILWAPGMPGQKLGQSLPYYFDEVLALRVERDTEGNPYRVLQSQPDGVWVAKDRSGCLDPYEAPDLGAVIRKIRGEG